MTRRRLARVAGSLVLLTAAAASAVPFADAATSPSPAASPSPSPSASSAAPGPLAATGQVQDLTLPVLDLSAPVQPLVFTEGTADGALVAIGTQDIRLAADVLFAFDRADLTPRARQLLDDAAARVRAAKATRLAVTGFTDSVGTPSYNLALSRRRADAVAAALRTRLGTGVAVSATGAGETRPIADNATKAGQALNRRVEVRAS